MSCGFYLLLELDKLQNALWFTHITLFLSFYQKRANLKAARNIDPERYVSASILASLWN